MIKHPNAILGTAREQFNLKAKMKHFKRSRAPSWKAFVRKFTQNDFWFNV